MLDSTSVRCCHLLSTGVDHSIRRYRARFCKVSDLANSKLTYYPKLALNISMTQKLSPVLLLLLVPIISIFSGACRQTTTTPTPTSAFDDLGYKKEIEKWQSDRLAALTKQDGWLTLIGLYWLKEGESRFGIHQSRLGAAEDHPSFRARS